MDNNGQKRVTKENSFTCNHNTQTYLIHHGVHSSGSLRVDSGRIEGMWVSLVNVEQEGQDLFHFLRSSIGVAHDSGQLTFRGIVSALGLVQDFVFCWRDSLSLQQTDNIGAGSVRNGQIEGSVVVVVLFFVPCMIPC